MVSCWKQVCALPLGSTSWVFFSPIIDTRLEVFLFHLKAASWERRDNAVKSTKRCVCVCACTVRMYASMDEKMPPWLCWKQDLVTVWLYCDSQHKLSAIFYTLIWEAFGPGLQRSRMQFHQTARNSAVVSTAAKSHQHAAVQRNWSRLRDVCMRYSVWLPSQENIWERERETDTLYTVDVNTPTLHSRIGVMDAEGKETRWKKISWKEEQRLECLCLFTHFHCTPSCTGVHSFAGPLHHLATHRGVISSL